MNHTFESFSFCFTMPTKIFFGIDMAENIGKIALEYGKNPLIITDKGLLETVLIDKCIESVKKNGMDFTIFGKVVPNPQENNVYEGVKIYKSNKSDMLLPIGGGSSIDSAKAIGAILSNNKTISELRKPDAIGTNLPPIIAVPTTAGSGSEVSGDSLITDNKTHEKLVLSDYRLAPSAAILDPKLTTSLPPDQTAFTAFDALTHAVEAYTVKGANGISDGIASQAIALIGKSIVKAYECGNDLEARSNMLLGSCMAGMAFANAGSGLNLLNAGLGSVHAMGQVLAGLYDLPHGATMAFFLPFVMEENLDCVVDKYANIATLLGVGGHGSSKKDQAIKGIQYIKDLKRIMKIPKLADFGVKPDCFEQCARLCETYKLNSMNPKRIDKINYEKIYKKAYQDD